MSDKDIAELWAKLSNAKNYQEVFALLKEAFKEAFKEGKYD